MFRDLISKKTAELVAASGACLIGDFLLKDGSRSDFFVDLGRVTGSNLRSLAKAVALELELIQPIDVLVAPPYKAIPLVSVISALTNLPFDFYRKEAKDYGEGGLWVTKALQPGSLTLIVDDVYTAGMAKREALQHIQAAGAIPVGILVVVNRAAGQGPYRVDGLPVYHLTTIEEVQIAFNLALTQRLEEEY